MRLAREKVIWDKVMLSVWACRRRFSLSRAGRVAFLLTIVMVAMCRVRNPLINSINIIIINIIIITIIIIIIIIKTTVILWLILFLFLLLILLFYMELP